MASTPGFEPRPHWCEASALITAPLCFPKRKKQNKLLKSIDLVKRKFNAIKKFKIQMFRRVRSGPVFGQVEFSYVPARMKRLNE